MPMVVFNTREILGKERDLSDSASRRIIVTVSKEDSSEDNCKCKFCEVVGEA
jgi:hypothetical protein